MAGLPPSPELAANDNSMHRLGTRGAGVCLVAMAAIAPSAGAPAASNSVSAVPAILIDDTVHAALVRKAVLGARRRLEEPRCAKLLSEFTDGGHRTLQANLDAAGESAPAYLGRIEFHDGTDRRPCSAAGVAAYTTPGSRAVWICTGRFAVAQNTDPDLAEYLIIHEALHSLGLGENPPSSEQITRRVARRCSR